MIALLIRYWWAPVILALCIACAGMMKMNDKLRDERNAARADAVAYASARAASEKARQTDQIAATSSYDALQDTCSAGITDAINRGRTIERILYRPAPAGGGRAVVTDVELRGLLGQAERDGSATGLSR